MLSVTCPSCHMSKNVPDDRYSELVGKSLTCKLCGVRFVPGAATLQRDGSSSTAAPDGCNAGSLRIIAIWWKVCAGLLVCVLLSGVVVWCFFSSTNSVEMTGQQAKIKTIEFGGAGSPLQPMTYTIVDIEEKNERDNPAGGVQHRRVAVVITPPQSKTAVENAARDVYARLRREIETLQPNAKYKRVNVLIYDGFHELDELICRIGTEGSVSELPKPESLGVEWISWRLPEYRPDDSLLTLYREYVAGLREARSTAEKGIFDEQGRYLMESGEADRLIESRRKIRIPILVRKMMEKYHLQESEFANRIAYVGVWRLGLKPTEENIAESAKQDMDQWHEYAESPVDP